MKLGTLCYIKKNGKTLMINRNKNRKNDFHKRKFVALGGKMESYETPEECILREVKEESGLTLKDYRLKGVLNYIDPKENDNWCIFVFLATEFDGNLVECEEGNLKWINNSKLLNLDMWESDKISLDWLDKKEFFSAKFIHQKGKIIEHNVIFY